MLARSLALRLARRRAVARRVLQRRSNLGGRDVFYTSLRILGSACEGQNEQNHLSLFNSNDGPPLAPPTGSLALTLSQPSLPSVPSGHRTTLPTTFPRHGRASHHKVPSSCSWLCDCRVSGFSLKHLSFSSFFKMVSLVRTIGTTLQTKRKGVCGKTRGRELMVHFFFSWNACLA